MSEQVSYCHSIELPSRYLHHSRPLYLMRHYYHPVGMAPEQAQIPLLALVASFASAPRALRPYDCCKFAGQMHQEPTRRQLYCFAKMQEIKHPLFKG
jgi:hypothetical protein